MIETLERFNIFQGLGPKELEAIRRLGKPVNVKKGDQLFQAGEPARSLFLVCAGKIELRFKVVCYNARVEIPLDTTTEGEVVGWSAMIPPYTYTLSAYAVEDAELLQLDQADIHSSCDANPHLGYLLMKNTARVIGERFQASQQMLLEEIQESLKRKDPLA